MLQLFFRASLITKKKKKRQKKREKLCVAVSSAWCDPLVVTLLMIKSLE